VFPIGKKSSGSSSRQAARLRQVIRLDSSDQKFWGISIVNVGLAAHRVGVAVVVTVSCGVQASAVVQFVVMQTSG